MSEIGITTDCSYFFRAMAFLKLVSDSDGTAVRDATHELLVNKSFHQKISSKYFIIKLVWYSDYGLESSNQKFSMIITSQPRGPWWPSGLIRSIRT